METDARLGRLGTFAGVFTPSILTILGIILFLRLGYVVGSAGLRNALAIIGLATVVSVLTSFSLAAISTNMEVRGGGDYYLISRTLGIEFGGAIGIVLFLAQSVSIAFYAMGFGEAIASLVGWEGAWPVQLIAAGAVLALFVLAMLGADVASRFQFVVMALLIGALGSFFFGAMERFDGDTLASSWSAGENGLPFWVVFAVFFPAVTGFTQGVSMSGDLRDPGRSLPTGTFAAVGISTVVYVLAAVALAGTVSLRQLSADPVAMGSVARIPALIDLGVIAATLSSAMASFLGAPRILQSLASDRVFPVLTRFRHGHGPSNNPRRAVLLSLAIALATVGLGSLNAIAPLVSMFFLISYGLLNYATYYEARAGSPSFRPRFRFFHPRISLIGAASSFVVMIAINPLAGLAASVVLMAVYAYIARSSHPERWSDASHSHYFRRAKENILLLAEETASARNWRPQVLAFSADPERRERLMRFAAWLEGTSGLSAVVQLIQGSGAAQHRDLARAKAELRTQARSQGVDVSMVVIAADVMEALPVVVQSFGVGPLRANTVLFGWPEQADAMRRQAYVGTLREIARLGKNVVSVASDADRWRALSEVRPPDRRIDVWWHDSDSGRLALLLAYLFTRTEDWKRCRFRLLTTVEQPAQIDAATADMQDMLRDVRIPAEPLAVTGIDGLVRSSRDAALVVVPARLTREGIVDSADRDLYSVFPQLPLTVAIVAAEQVDLNAGPESPDHLVLTAAEQRAEAAETRLGKLEDQLSKAKAQLANLQERVARDIDVSAEDIENAESRVADLHRRTLKGRAVAEQARHDVDALTSPG